MHRRPLGSREVALDRLCEKGARQMHSRTVLRGIRCLEEGWTLVHGHSNPRSAAFEYRGAVTGTPENQIKGQRKQARLRCLYCCSKQERRQRG